VTLRSHPGGRTPLSWAAERGRDAVIRLLLATDQVDPDSKATFAGRTPLSWAAGEGCEGVVKFLLATNGVDPDSKDESGRTPLSFAAEGGREVVVTLLLTKDGPRALSPKWTSLDLLCES